MSNKKFILNADDFGLSFAHNRAILEGIQGGILKSASLAANGEAFDEAVQKIIPACPDLGIGVHLNILEGKALSAEIDKLTDINGNFNNSFLKLFIKAYNYKDNLFFEQVEKEFRAQIEKVKNAGIKITHLDSHKHLHVIPPIFDIVCKLAKEYGISQVRTHFEKPYIIPDIIMHLNSIYFVNIIRTTIFGFLTYFNKLKTDEYRLKTNDYLLGLEYNSMMTPLSISYGLIALKGQQDITVEAVIHPCRYEEGTIDNYFTEYRITKNQKLKNKIEKLGFEITNYSQSQEEEG